MIQLDEAESADPADRDVEERAADPVEDPVLEEGPPEDPDAPAAEELPAPAPADAPPEDWDVDGDLAWEVAVSEARLPEKAPAVVRVPAAARRECQ